MNLLPELAAKGLDRKGAVRFPAPGPVGFLTQIRGSLEALFQFVAVDALAGEFSIHAIERRVTGNIDAVLYAQLAQCALKGIAGKQGRAVMAPTFHVALRFVQKVRGRIGPADSPGLRRGNDRVKAPNRFECGYAASQVIPHRNLPNDVRRISSFLGGFPWNAAGDMPFVSPAKYFPLPSFNPEFPDIYWFTSGLHRDSVRALGDFLRRKRHFVSASMPFPAIFWRSPLKAPAPCCRCSLAARKRSREAGAGPPFFHFLVSPLWE